MLRRTLGLNRAYWEIKNLGGEAQDSSLWKVEKQVLFVSSETSAGNLILASAGQDFVVVTSQFPLCH